MGRFWWEGLSPSKLAYIQLISAIYSVTLSDLYKPEWCTKCGGMCCKKSACGVVPFDLEVPITMENIRKLLETGKYMIAVDFIYEGKQGDRYYGFPQNIKAVPYLSIREENADSIHINPMHNKCAMLGKKGCTLSLQERGTNGILVKPAPRMEECYNLMRQPSESWIPYRGVLEEIVKTDKGKSVQELSDMEWIRVSKIMKKKCEEISRTRKVSRQDWEIMNTLMSYGEVHPLFALALVLAEIKYP